MALDLGVNLVVVIGVLLVLLINWRTQRAAGIVIESAAKCGPMTDRWTSAVTMLAGDEGGPSSVEARLGAVYVLEQIARESSPYRIPATELLAACVRRHAQLGVAGLEPTPEVQSILTVLGRSGTEGIDLRRTTLWGADLEGAGLVEANFDQSRLRGVRLAGARLMRARMRDADLGDADLSGADLSGADLRGARLSGTDLGNAILRGADLRDAILSRATLRGADLREASLSGAVLADAVLDDARLDEAALDGVDLERTSLGGTALGRDDARQPLIGRSAVAASTPH
jgi:uncharacterized protein YjbI with pentapeptide repeats